MHAILATIGTDGDVFPYFGLGAKLPREATESRWRRTNPSGRAVEHGFAFQPLVSSEETRDFLNNPDTWHPLKGPGFLRVGEPDSSAGSISSCRACEGCGRCVGRVSRRTRRASRAGKNGPAAGVHSSSAVDDCQRVAPPIMPGGLTLPTWAPRPLGRLYWRAVDVVGTFLMGGPLQRVRAISASLRCGASFNGGCRPSASLDCFLTGMASRSPTGRRICACVGFRSMMEVRARRPEAGNSGVLP